MKGLILDEFCATCGYHCKYAIRLLRKPKRKPSAARVRGRPGPKSSYQQPEIVTILKRLWFVTDQMCSKKLKAAIPLWLPFYEQEYGGNGVRIAFLLFSRILTRNHGTPLHRLPRLRFR